MIEAVLLDVGGVFFVPEHEPLLGALRRFGLAPSPDDLDRGHYAGIATIDRAGSVDIATYHLAVAEACGVASPDHDEVAIALREAESAWHRVVPGSVEALRRLAATGVGIGIVSNSDGSCEGLLRDKAVCQTGPGAGVEVTVILDSHVVGVAKPDPRIFHLALDRLGVAPGRAVHVGDMVTADVEGARAAGIRPIHLDPHRFCRLDDHEHARSLDDVTALVLQSRS